MWHTTANITPIDVYEYVPIKQDFEIQAKAEKNAMPFMI